MAEKETAAAENKTPKPNAEKEAAAAPPPKAGMKQTLVAVLVVLGMMLGSASAAVLAAGALLRNGNAPATQEPAAAPEHKAGGEAKGKGAAPVEFTLKKSLIVNVYQTQQRRLLSVSPVFVMQGEEAQKELEGKQAELQHLLISLMKTKTLDQLDDPNVTDALAREAQELVNLKLGLNGKNIKVYFTEFVVQ